MSDIQVIKSDGTPQIIADAMQTLVDPETPVEDKAAIYGVLHQMQLRMNRALRSVKDDLIVYMESNGVRDFGPLSIKATSIDARWPVNDEGNWTDYGVQDELAAFAKIAPDYIRHVPEHYEIRTAELGAGIAAGDPVAKQLHAECKARRWRTEEGRRLSLAVQEAKVGRSRAA